MKSFLEHWKPVYGYEGLYEVSDFGEVRRLAGKGSKQTRVLKPDKLKNDYLLVVLCKNGKVKNHYIHRLVAEAFIPNPDNLPEVNHKDETPGNNVVANLEYCDHAYNMAYGTRNKRISEAMTNGKLSKKVVQLTLDYIFVKELESTAECGRNGFYNGNVSKCCNNKYCSQGNVYKGYRWVYAEDYYKKFVA